MRTIGQRCPVIQSLGGSVEVNAPEKPERVKEKNACVKDRLVAFLQASRQGIFFWNGTYLGHSHSLLLSLL